MILIILLFSVEEDSFIPPLSHPEWVANPEMIFLLTNNYFGCEIGKDLTTVIDCHSDGLRLSGEYITDYYSLVKLLYFSPSFSVNINYMKNNLIEEGNFNIETFLGPDFLPFEINLEGLYSNDTIQPGGSIAIYSFERKRIYGIKFGRKRSYFLGFLFQTGPFRTIVGKDIVNLGIYARRWYFKVKYSEELFPPIINPFEGHAIRYCNVTSLSLFIIPVLFEGGVSKDNPFFRIKSGDVDIFYNFKEKCLSGTINLTKNLYYLGFRSNIYGWINSDKKYRGSFNFSVYFSRLKIKPYIGIERVMKERTIIIGGLRYE